jgi:glucose-like phosphotransferase system IIB component
MKKANFINFLIIVIIFSLFYIVDIILRQNNIDIYLNLDLGDGTKITLLIALYLLVMVSSVIYASRAVYKLYIKHLRKTKLTNSRFALVISALFISYVFLLFEVEYYYYFGSIIVLYLLYFISLYMYDVYFVRSQQEKKVVVNNEVAQNFLQLLGGKDNIISVTYEHSRLKVELKNIKIVQLDAIKSLGASGVFIAGNKLQAVIGSNAGELENALRAYLL